MTTRNILHISDLHCTKQGVATTGDSKGFEWNRNLAEQCAKHIRKKFDSLQVPHGGRADLILITGDFVHQCCPAFEAANEFIQAFVNVFSDNQLVPDVILCPGNHDYLRRREDVGDHVAARAKYWDFAANWHEKILNRGSNRRGADELANKLVIQLTPFYGAQLVTPIDRMFGPVLTIDATWRLLNGRASADAMGPALHNPKFWTDTEAGLAPLFQIIVDHLAEIKSAFPNLVLIHYPVAVSHTFRELRRKDVVEDEHVSSAFKGLIELLVERTGKPTLVFSGDVHEPDEFDIPFLHTPNSWARQFVSGRCYLPFGEKPRVPWRACARMVVVRNDGIAKEDVRSVLLKYGDDTIEEFNPSFDHWNLHSSSRAIDAGWLAEAESVERQTNAGIHDGGSEGSESTPAVSNRILQEDDSNELELFLLQNRPVELMRVKCWGDERLNRLMQIRVGPIMNHTEAREYSIRQLVEQLKNWLDSPQEILLVGLDCWGHSLASRLGFELAVKSVGLSVRGLTDDEFNVELERRGLKSADSIPSGLRRLCYVTDIIATGDTVRRVKLAVSQNAQTAHSCVSLIRSEFSHRHGLLDGIESFSVLDHFPIPILQDDELPPDKILPARSFGLR